MPIGQYKNFDACYKAQIAKGKSAESAKKICGKLYWKTHGKKEGSQKLKHEIFDIKEMIKRVLNNDR